MATLVQAIFMLRVHLLYEKKNFLDIILFFLHFIVLIVLKKQLAITIMFNV